MKSLVLVMLATVVAPMAAQAQVQDEGAGFGGPSQGGFRGNRQGRVGRGEGGGGRGQMFAELGLSEKQRTQISSIMKESREKNRPLFEKMRALREAKSGASALDEKSLSEMRSLRAQMKQERKATNDKIQALLTAEQKAKWSDRQSGFARGGGDFNGAGGADFRRRGSRFGSGRGGFGASAPGAGSSEPGSGGPQ